MLHELKIRKLYFDKVISAQKKAELRKNDRGFKVNDLICLREYEQNKYTGRQVIVKVTDVTDVMEYTRERYVMLSIDII